MVSETEVDYTEAINIKFIPEKLAAKDKTLDELKLLLENGSKKEVKIDIKNSSLKVIVEDSDATELFTLRNKLLGLRVSGIKEIKNLTIVSEKLSKKRVCTSCEKKKCMGWTNQLILDYLK